MSGGPASSAPTLDERERRSPREVLSFLAIGSAGFIIDATVLTALTHYGWSPWLARIPSFLIAVLATWALNRRHTFPDRGLQRRSVEAFLYVMIQSGGALLNLAIFWLCLALQPRLLAVPVIPLAFGSAGGLVFNYLMSSKWLYGRSRARSDASR